MAYPLPTVDASPDSSPDATAPRRPAAVPDTSVWNAERGKWEVSRTDAGGVREGECLLYRDDGTLYSRTQFVAGVQEGPFAIYHRNGSVAREGRFVGGRFDGTVSAYTCDAPGSERLRSCCVPPGASRLDERWRAGDFLLEVFYDREGRAILSDGRLCPLRPEGLPDLAQFDEARGGWALRSREVDRFWTVDGALNEEVVHGEGGARVVRRFDDDGRLLQESGVGADDRLDGPFFRRFPAAEPSAYADARIRQERGAWAGGQAIGPWTFLDADGNVVRAIDRGAPLGDGALARLLAPAPDGDWWSRARALMAEGLVREAFVAAARAAAAERDRAALERFRAEHVVPLTAEREAQWGASLAQSTDATAVSILDALICGADPAAAYRALAAVLPGVDPAPMDLVEASLLLAPERRATHLTRALLRCQRGDLAGALADADVVAGESPDAADSLRSWAAMVFRAFDDWPRREALATDDPELEGVTLELTRDLADIRRVVDVYATRIGRARDAILALGAPRERAGAWLPPDTTRLLSAGPVALRRETIACDPDPDAPPAAEASGDGALETIEIDEGLATDGVGVPTLLAAAHADWAALSWLCWALGADGVGAPDAVATRAEVPAAMKLFVRRTWRIKDRLASGSLISRSQGVPGFEWQGVDIDALPRHVAEIVVSEYLAVRSMFIWLASPDALSPFQDDIQNA